MKNKILEILDKYSKTETSDNTGHVREWIDSSDFEHICDDIDKLCLPNNTSNTLMFGTPEFEKKLVEKYRGKSSIKEYSEYLDEYVKETGETWRLEEGFNKVKDCTTCINGAEDWIQSCEECGQNFSNWTPKPKEKQD